MADITGNEEEIYGDLARQLRAAPRVDPGLLSRVIDTACARAQVMASAGKTTPLNLAMRASAWNETALLLVELELPLWRPRRLINESSEWLCSLSRYPSLPVEYDDTADGRHESLAMAILLSLVEVKKKMARKAIASRSSVPQTRPRPVYPFCCDNFG